METTTMPTTAEESTIQFIDYTPEQKTKTCNLLSNYSHPRYVREPKMWDWFYEENPFIRNDSDLGISITENGEIIGYNGLMPTDVLYKGQLRSVTWSFDTILSPQCRGKGLGKKLAIMVMKSHPLVLGLGISDLQASIMRKIGYAVNEDIEQLFYLKKVGTIRQLVKYSLQILNKIRFRRTANTNDYQIELIPATPTALDKEEIDQLWEKCSTSYQNIVVRNHAYLSWKYGSHPEQSYCYIKVKAHNKLIGLGVIEPKIGTSRLVDYLGNSDDYQTKLIIVNQFIKHCVQSELLECTSTDSQLKEILLSFGFRPYRERPLFYVASNIHDDKEPEKNWFVMGGDSD